jgi:hypothetical protein
MLSTLTSPPAIDSLFTDDVPDAVAPAPIAAPIDAFAVTVPATTVKASTEDVPLMQEPAPMAAPRSEFVAVTTALPMNNVPTVEFPELSLRPEPIAAPRVPLAVILPPRIAIEATDDGPGPAPMPDDPDTR